MRLDRAYSDIIGVTLFPRSDSYGGWQESQNISVYLSSTAAYANNSNTVTCVEGFTGLIERTPVFIACTGASGKDVQFVTVQRVWSSAITFSLQELQIQRNASEFRGWLGWPLAHTA